MVRTLIIAGLGLVAVACGVGKGPSPADLPPWKLTKDRNGVEVRLLEKRPYTYLYGLDGNLREMRYDNNDDQRPDVFAFFSGRSTPDRLEIDGNRDGRVDLWEEYDAAGTLVRYASATKGTSPDRFVEMEPGTKSIARIEFDADLDGRRERREFFQAGKLVRSEQDTNGDGRVDRTQFWNNGVLTSEELDRDGDGRADVRLRRSRNGAVSSVEPIR